MINIPGIDTEKVNNLYNNDKELYTAVLASCLENTPALLESTNKLAEELRNGIKNQSLDETLADYAVNIHGLKGTFGTIGAEDLKKEAIELETIVKSGDVKGVLAKNDAFLNQAFNLLDEIKKWQKQ